MRVFSFLDTYPAEKIIRGATYASVTVAALLILIKGFAWWTTHSLSLQASFIDSILDIAASLINLLAVRTSLQPPDYFHRFGHGKAESLAALIQSIFIALSAGWLLKQVVERLYFPIALQETSVGLNVMVISIILTSCLILYQGYVVQRTKNEAITADRLHYYSDLLTNASVFISLSLVEFFSVLWIDALFGGLIALYILKTSWDIARHAVNILMDHELPEKDRKKIRKIISSFLNASQIKDFRTRAAGMKQFIQFHLILDNHSSFEKTCALMKNIEKEIHLSFPQAEVMIQPIFTKTKSSLH